MRVAEIRALLRGAGDRDSARGRTVRLMSATAMSQLIAIAVSPLLTRLLGPAAFGVFGVYLALLGSLGSATSWRLGMAVSLPESDDDAAALVVAGVLASIGTSLLAGFAVWLFGDRLARTLLDGPGTVSTLWLVPTGMLGVGLTDVVSGWGLRHRAFDALVRIRVSRSVVTSGWQVIAAVAARTSAIGLAMGDVVGRVVSSAELARVIVRTERARGTRVTWARVREIVSRYRAFPLISAPSTVLNAAGAWAPVFFLTYWWGPVASGLYVIGQRVIGVPIGLLGDSAGQVYISELAARARGPGETMPSLFAKTAKGLLLVGALPAVAMLLLAPTAFHLVFGREWGDAGVMVQWQALALTCQLVAIPLAHTLLVLRFQRRQLAWDVLRFLLTAAGFLLAHRAGMSAIGAIAVFSAVTAATYLALIVLSWYAVLERAAEHAAQRTGRAPSVLGGDTPGPSPLT